MPPKVVAKKRKIGDYGPTPLTPTQVLDDDDIPKKSQQGRGRNKNPAEDADEETKDETKDSKKKKNNKGNEEDDAPKKTTKIDKKLKSQPTKETHRYATLREMSGGIIEEDKRLKNPCKTRKDVIEKYALKDINGIKLPAVRINYRMCLVDKDEKMKATVGSEVGLVRGTVSNTDFIAAFLKHGWDAQLAGVCTIHVTEDVAEILAKMTLREQTDWLSLPETLRDYKHYIIDGAHRVELGLEKFSPTDDGIFILMHPSMPFENRERVALSSNALSIMINTTDLRDKLVYVIKKLQYGYTCKEIKEDVQGSWGEDGAMSQLKQCAEILDLKGWKALHMDYESLNPQKKSPVMTIAILLLPLFKAMPQDIRGDVLVDIVTKTMKKEIYPGCGQSCRKPVGREQALWVSTVRHMCLKEVGLGKVSKLIIIKGMSAENLAAMELKFRKEDINSEIGRAVGVGDGKVWTPPTVDHKKLNSANVMQAVNVIMKRLLGEPYYQPKQVRSEDEEDEEEVTATLEEEYQEHPVEVD
jgi:hypothetical protein